MREMISWVISGVFAVLGQPAADDLNGPSDASERVLHFVRDHRRHFTEARQRRLFAELGFDATSLGQIVQDARELGFAIEHHLANRQVQRERRAVLSASGDLASDADDLLDVGGLISREIMVVLLVIRRRHEDVDVAPDDLRLAITEQSFRRRIERLDASVSIDDDDRVDGRFDNGAPPRLARSQLFFEIHAIAEVVEHARELSFAANRPFRRPTDAAGTSCRRAAAR